MPVVNRATWMLLALALAPALTPACTDSREKLMNRAEIGGSEASVFQLYGSGYCRIEDESGAKSMTIPCGKMRDFLGADAPTCSRGPFVPRRGYFPGKVQAMRLCQKAENATWTERKILRFAVMGDIGAGNDATTNARQGDVAAALRTVCPPNTAHVDVTAPAAPDASRPCDFALVPGDVVYPRGISGVWDRSAQERFEQPYAAFGRFDFFLVPGNHDYKGNITAAVEYTWFSERWRLPARHYAVPSLPSWLSIYGLDTPAMLGEHEAPNTKDEQLSAVESHVCTSTGWRILVGHHPPLSHGQHGPSEEIAAELDRLAGRCPFDLYLTGHDHDMEHVSTDSFEVMVQGGGGATVKDVQQVSGVQTWTLPHRTGQYEQKFAASKHGFAIVEASPEALDVYFFTLETWSVTPGVVEKTPRFADAAYRCRFKTAAAGEHRKCEPF